MSDVLWSTESQGGQDVDLVHLENDLYELSMGEIYDSGNSVWLSREQLKELHEALDKELYPPRVCPCGKQVKFDEKLHSCILMPGHQVMRECHCRCGKKWTYSEMGRPIEMGVTK